MSMRYYAGAFAEFRRVMAERRAYRQTRCGEWEWRTRAARKLVWWMRGVPANGWRT